MIFVIANDPPVYIGFGALRLIFYLIRKIRRATVLAPVQWLQSGARIMVGMALPIAWTIEPSSGIWLPIAGVLCGELIDRAEFYSELDIPGPRRQAIVDLQRAIGASS